MDDTPLADVRQRALVPQILFLAMRLVPFIWIRASVARVLAFFIGRREHATSGENPEAKRTAVALRQQGLVELPPLLSTAQVDEMLAYLGEQELVARDGKRFHVNRAPDDVALASYPLRTVLQCPYVLDLLNRPELLEIASNYLGCAPTASGLRIDWSRPSSNGRGYVQQFHRDYDDWRFLKVFVYLTDADDDSGPHEYVLRSHRRSGRLQFRPYDDEGVARRYGRERMIRVTGPRGTSFLADTWGIHRGGVPTRGYRLLLQVQYSLLPVFKTVYAPVSLPLQTPLDPYTNRLLVQTGNAAGLSSGAYPAAAAMHD